MANTLPDIKITPDDWVDIYDISGIDIGTPLIIFNKGSTMIYAKVSPTKPDLDDKNGLPLTPAEGETPSIVTKAGAEKIWLKALNRDCNVNVTEGPAYAGEVSLQAERTFDHLTKKMIGTVSLSDGEIESYAGNRFYVEINENFLANEDKYFLFDMPPESEGVVVILQNRDFATSESFAEYEIYWNASGYAAGSEIATFNENKRSTNVAKMKAYRLDDGTDPTVLGIKRESGFAGSGAGGATGTGAIDPKLGVRVYDDQEYIIKILNGANAQKIKIAYEWIEKPASDFNFG